MFLHSSNENDSDEEPKRFQSQSDSSPCKSPEFGTGELNDDETIINDKKVSDDAVKSSNLELEQKAKWFEEEEEECEDSDFEVEVGDGAYKEQTCKRNTKASPSLASSGVS